MTDRPLHRTALSQVLSKLSITSKKYKNKGKTETSEPKKMTKVLIKKIQNLHTY